MKFNNKSSKENVVLQMVQTNTKYLCPDRNGANTPDGRQAYSTDLGRREVDIGGGGFSQSHSYLCSDVESAMGSISLSLCIRSSDPGQRETRWCVSIVVLVSASVGESDGAGTSTIPDHAPEALHPGEGTTHESLDSYRHHTYLARESIEC